ncbi:hypothetical protein PIB30_060426 [Stylosanthes scabra]|uniref:Aminotransferase-like plant mobile domain-containing protein n=1 Tax=Stylosanthes scabra TaxID=79078 RepID=A0ABU6TKD1_9FABA|nr:hypothetical protein [Stylosanthes scabra]
MAMTQQQFEEAATEATKVMYQLDHIGHVSQNVTVEDVAYQLDLPLDGETVSGCLSEFPKYMPSIGKPAWEWFEELFGQHPPESVIDKMTVTFSWFTETFAELPAVASDEMVLRHARAYIVMLLSTQIFGDKTAAREHLRWLPFLARWERYLSTSDERDPRLFIWEPYLSEDVAVISHPEIFDQCQRDPWMVVVTFGKFVGRLTYSKEVEGKA